MTCDAANRIAPNDNAPFISGQIWGKEIDILVDTGATVTILSKRIFDTLDSELRKTLKTVDTPLQTASGKGLTNVGKLEVPLCIQDLEVNWTCVVAETNDDLILGMDFIRRHSCTVATKGEGYLELLGQKIPFVNKVTQHKRCCSVKVAETVEIPAKSEMVFPGRMNPRRLDSKKNAAQQTGIIMPTNQFQEREQLTLAGTLADSDQGCVTLRVINFTDEVKTLYAGTTAGIWQPVEVLETYPSEWDFENEQEQLRQVTVPSETELPVHLQTMWEDSGENLDDQQKERLKVLLTQNQDVFAKDDTDLGCATRIKHVIDTGTAQPIKQAPRRLPLSQADEAKSQIQAMLKNGIIEPSESPWAAPIVLVKKKDGSTRFCIDYRKLNSITVKDAYPLPRIDESIDCLAGSKWFSTLDLASGYWQVDMAEEDRRKTTFTTRNGLFQFKVMPFGLCNAPSTFERLMELELAGLQWVTCLVYIDDIIIFASTVDEHLTRLGQVLDRLRRANLKLKPRKCHLFKREVAYLGHVVSDKGVATDPEKVNKVKNWPTPRCLKDLRSFLGLCSYYRRFIEGCSRIARPLFKLVEKEAEFVWTDECENAFQELKTKLTTAPILAYPSREGKFILDTDASDFAIGAVLSQVQEGHERVIGYASRTLNKHEKNYAVTRKEMLAVVNFVHYYRHYLTGRPFTVRTDHGSLRWLKQFKEVNGQTARWIARLDTYDMTIEHRPGRNHGNADALSRIPEEPSVEAHDQVEVENSFNHATPDEAEKLSDFREERVNVITRSQSSPRSEATQSNSERTNPIEVAEGTETLPPEIESLLRNLSQAQKDDPDLQAVIQWKIAGERPSRDTVAPHSPSLKRLWAKWKSLEYCDDVLYNRWTPPEESDSRLLLVLPSSMKKTVLQQLHNSCTGGHLGVARTLSAIRTRYYWCGMEQDVRDWCQQCSCCQQANPPPRKLRAPLQQYQVGAPLERVALDMAGRFPETENGNKYILVISDYFTKWTEVVPLPDITAQTVAQAFVTNFICRFGTPIEIVTDQGRQFESELFQELCKYLDIDKKRTSPWHPQTNGLVERFNRTIVNMLRKYVAPHQRDWDQHIPYLLMAYRATKHASTGQTPNRMMLGNEIRRPIDLTIGGLDLVKLSAGGFSCSTPHEYVEKMKREMDKSHALARKHLKKSAERQKKNHDRTALERNFREGQNVLLFHPLKKKGLNPKLQKNWKGPFPILTKVNDVNYKIGKGTRGKFQNVHIDRLKLYQERTEEPHDSAEEFEDDLN